MKKALFLSLLFFALNPAVIASPTAAAVTGGSTKSVDQKAAYLDKELSFVKSAPQIQKIPMSYRIAAICGKNTAKLLEAIQVDNERRTTSLVVLTKAEQLPPTMRSAPGCPQCNREKAMINFISIEFSNWLRMLPESRLEEIAHSCEKI